MGVALAHVTLALLLSLVSGNDECGELELATAAAGGGGVCGSGFVLMDEVSSYQYYKLAATTECRLE